MSGFEKKEYSLASSESGQKLHVITWIPTEQPVKAVLQIVHGMIEYIDRYDGFAAYLAENGIAVVGHDQLGHGLTAENEDALGFFAENNGDKRVIEDISRVTKTMEGKYPEVPFFIMGHSMGSYFTRKYLTKYSGLVDGAIIMGTGTVPAPVAKFGHALAGAICKAKGGHYRSKLLVDMSLGSNNKKIKNPRTTNDWLSRNEENVDKYNADPLCGYRFTASAYKDFFKILSDLGDHKGDDKIKKDLPVLFVAGEEDPVGSYGNGVIAAAKNYKAHGILDVEIILYPEDRHEILNEVDKEKVYQDIKEWLEKKISKN